MSISVSAMKDSQLPQKHSRYSAKAFSLNEKNQELENRLRATWQLSPTGSR